MLTRDLAFASPLSACGHPSSQKAFLDDSITIVEHIENCAN
jgi:hypothetical protein